MQFMPKTIIIALLLAYGVIMMTFLYRDVEAVDTPQIRGNLSLGTCTKDCTVTPKATFTKVNARVTAYTSRVKETDSTPFITANGEHVAPGTLACPAQYPFGTQVRINGHLYACNDRMSKTLQATHNNTAFDIWMESYDEAITWGIKWITVEVIE